MPYKDAQKRKEFQKKYSFLHREKKRSYAIAYRKKNLAKVTAKRKEWILAHPERVKELARRKNHRYREKALQYYSKGKMSCNCCGEKEYKFLAIDHIHGGGSQNRRLYSGSLAAWLVRNELPEGFQILCHNCNMAKGLYGNCPHQKSLEISPKTLIQDIYCK